MHPLIDYEVATARIADLRRQAHHDALARAAAHPPSRAPLPGRHPIAVSRRRVGRPRRFGMQLWTLLHAQALLDGPATVPHRRHPPGHTGTFPVPPGMRATTTSMSGSPSTTTPVSGRPARPSGLDLRRPGAPHRRPRMT